MKRVLQNSLLMVLLSLFFSSALAGVGDDELFPVMMGPYLGIHAGISDLGGPGANSLVEMKPGPVIGAHGGYQMGNVRIEGALSYYSNPRNKDDSVKLHLMTLMGNGYYDFNFNFPIIPFVGTGIGWLHSWVTGGAIDANKPDDNEFAYQFMAGLNFRVNNRTTVGVVYHFLAWSDGNGHDNVILASVNYLFP